jgi:hypothetical protein
MEKASGRQDDMDTVFARNVLRLGGRYKGSEDGPLGKRDRSGRDEDEQDEAEEKRLMALYNHKGGDDVFDPAALAQAAAREQGRQRAWEQALATCRACATASGRGRDGSLYRVAQSPAGHISVQVASRGMTPLHIELIPTRHVGSTMQLEEEEWAELTALKIAIRGAFSAAGLGAGSCV